MALPPISTVLAGIQHIPNKATQDLLEFDVTATQFATEMQTLGSQANTWAGEVNTLKAAINVILGLLQDPLDPPADILRYLRSPGDIVWSTGPTPGVGTLVADGTAVSRTTYADLWSRYNAAGWTWEECTIAYAWVECTISVANPCAVHKAGHGFTGGEQLQFQSVGGTLPSGLSAATTYYVVVYDADYFYLSSTRDTVTYVATTTAGSGTPSFLPPCVVANVDHGFTGGERLRFKATGGALPTGLSASIDYFVVHIGDDTFHLSSTQGKVTSAHVTTAGAGTFSYLRSLWGIGDGTTTFNLPNLLGIFPAGVSSYGSVNSGRDANRQLGHVLASQNQVHTHDINCARYSLGEAGAASGDAIGFYHETVTEAEGGAEAYPWHVALLPCVVY